MKNQRIKPIAAAVNAGLLLMLSACSGGSDDPKPVVSPPPPPPPPEPTSFNVTVIDGYIRGAIAYIDLNGNKQLDEGEPFTETVEGGEGVIDTTGLGLVPEDVSVIVDIPAGAVDESTITDENPDGVPIADGEAFQLVSLPGENVATPVTTLVSLVAGENGDIEQAKEDVAEQLGISTDEASSDYIADGNEELTVLTEVMIESEVIPKNVTTDINSADVVIATEVTSTIANVIDQASDAGTLTEQKEVISEVAGAVTSAVNAVTEENSEQLADIDDAVLGDIVEQVADATSSVYTNLVVSEEQVTDEALSKAKVQAEIVSDVVSENIIEQGVSEEGLTEEAIEEIQASTEVISDVVEELVEEQAASEEGLSEDAVKDIQDVTDIIADVVENIIADQANTEGGLTAEDIANVTTAIEVVTQIVEQLISDNDGSEGTVTVEDVAAIAQLVAEEVVEQVEELADSGLSEEEIQDEVSDNANETAADLEDAVKNDVEIDDLDGDGIANDEDDDIDGDGVANENDALPYNENESMDADGDGIGNNEDTDDDNDGVSDDNDAFPFDSNESVDSDEDGIGNNADNDDDNDGVVDDEDVDSTNPNVAYSGLADDINAGTMYLLWDDFDDENNDVSVDYETLTVDPTTKQADIVEYVPSDETDSGVIEFVRPSADEDDDSDLYLTQSGWQISEQDYAVTAQNSNGETTFVNGVGNTVTIVGELVDSTSMSMSEALASAGLTGWSLNVDETANFDADAKVYVATAITGTDEYQIDYIKDCNDCNTLYLDGKEKITALDDLFSEDPWHPDQGVSNYPPAVTIAYNEDGQGSIEVELLASNEDTGTMRIFVNDDGQPRLLSVEGQWRIETVMEQNIVRFTLPENVAELAGFDIDIEEVERTFFALARGYVRKGEFTAANTPDVDGVWMNQAAFDQMMEHFSLVDTDGDGEFDIFDNDDDNDGVEDIDDAFARDNTRKYDLDGDGIADSVDTDIDGDGVENDMDIAPENADYGQASAFTVDDIANQYVAENKTGVDDGIIALWSGTQTHFSFDEAGSGVLSGYHGQADFTWTLTNNKLAIDYTDGGESISWISFADMVDLGLISMQEAKNYCYELDCSIELSTKLTSSTLYVVENDQGLVKFWQNDIREYELPIDSYGYSQYPGLAELLIGNSVETEYEVSYIDVDSAQMTAFDSASLEGQWVLPTTISDDNRILADLITFNSDGTATSKINDLSLTWTINEGVLAVTGSLGDKALSMSYSQFAQYEDGVAIYAEISYGEQTLYAHHMGMKASAEPIEFEQTEEFLLSGVTLSNAYAATGSTDFPLEDLFGFYFHNDGEANRIFGNTLLDGNYPEIWAWQQAEDSTIVMDRFRSRENNAYLDSCVEEVTEECYVWRNRNWFPIKQVGDRLYVMEWSIYNITSDPENPQWEMLIPGRLNFYETYQSDLVDSAFGSQDVDSDGIANANDAFPEDNFEWADSDGDGVGNNADSDDDNDGVSDWEDVFPEDDSESSDYDQDGIGDNADTDDDNDGVSDEDDLSPLDADVSTGIAFTADNLAPKYLHLFDGMLDAPSISIGHITGDIYSFTNGQVDVSSPEGSSNFSYSFNDDKLTIDLTSDSPELTFETAQALADMGVITQEIADNYVSNYGSNQIEVERQDIALDLLLLENGDTKDTFWQLETISYRVVDAQERINLFGDENAEDITITSDGSVLELTEYDSVTFIAYTAEEIEGSWGMPVTFDSNADYETQRVVSDYAMFNADNTGSTTISDVGFTWELDNGSLIITHTTGEVLSISRLESHENVDVVLVTTTVDDIDYSLIRLSAKGEADVSIDDFVGEFMMNSFTLTSPFAYDEEGMILDEEYFGFRLNDDETVNRIYNGKFDLETGFGNDGWFWTQISANEVELSARATKYDYDWNYQQYANCDLADDSCYKWRERHWKILKETDNQLVVLEWEYWDYGIWQEVYEKDIRLLIPPRVQFYQKFSLDSDRDGLTDDVDLDDDNDGFADTEDDYPYDRNEWLDTDGDGIGNNQDDDDDGDGVNDWDDVFPLDGTETIDSDMDGIGNNADTDDDNDGVVDENDLDPLDDELGAALPFNEDMLPSRYLQYAQGYLSEPSISIGNISGEVYNFNDGEGKLTGPSGQHIYDYYFTGNTLSVSFSDGEATVEFLDLNSLAHQGIISYEALDEYLSVYGHQQINFLVKTTNRELLLLDDGEVIDKFKVNETKSYQVENADDRAILFGSVDAEPVIIGDSHIIELADMDALGAINFTVEEVVGSWGLPVKIDSEAEFEYQTIVSDFTTFNSDLTGHMELSDTSFNWSLNEGIIHIDFSNTDSIKLQRIESSSGGDVVLVIANISNKEYSVVSLASKVDENAKYDNFLNQFMMNSFTLTNPENYDEAGNLIVENYFGFMLNDDQTAQRVIGEYDFSSGQGVTPWRWSADSLNEVILTAQADVNESGELVGSIYSDCVIDPNTCVSWRKRHWRILSETSDKLFVLEWEYWGPPIQDVEEGQDFKLIIVPRVQFYQKFELED
ncbi:hypothetical protein tloyanaT_06250 [Thalassotalea loyana]|uniref:Uncharacterized protein n=1 Tax=Thalassotalea loyana TaxID=280483 RepID=A0ABQ6H8B1_9GAMM|nr:hypothetical protein [Thalassotalea loyana]GLX84373.1 hypothetical protein tloyanaT_06250 [Thalassotalea loyana]